MLHRNTLSRASSWIGIVALGALFVSCSDPVRDAEITRLGDEPGDVPVGELHRAGQPCLVCHSDGGPASKAKFAVAGTVFASNAADAMGAADIRVLFIDAASAQREATTNESGNFFIAESDWPDLTFPFKVGIVNNGQPIQMRSTVNREGSCNFCHKPTPGSPHAVQGDDTRESIGQIYVAAQAAGTTK